MAESVVGFAVERLAYLLIHKASFLLEVKDQVEQMQTELRRMQCFLEDADAKQEEDKKVRNWIAEIREVAYDAEDVVENFILHVEKEGKIRGMVRQMDFSVGSKIQDIQKKISDLTRSLETYGIKTVRESEASSSRYELQQRRRRTYPHLIEEDVVGLEENVKELCLNLDQSWELLKKKAMFPERGPDFAWENLGKQMVGLFPKDTEVSTKKLIQMWVAEGIVTSMNEEKAEDIAERYLGELIDRCMVEVGARSLTGRVKTCRLHDLMRDLCLLKAKEQSFLQGIHLGHEKEPITVFSSSMVPVMPTVTGATKLRLSDLCHLETLSLLDARKSNVKELVKLTSLRKLEIVSLESFEELEVIFNSPSPILNSLRSLSVEILDDRVEEGNLTQFLQACHNDFYRLSIDGALSKLPDPSKFKPNLSNTMLKCKTLLGVTTCHGIACPWLVYPMHRALRTCVTH
ncbi:hypothetical protein VitviT2T_013998 [Vitis vinifera]|uniref:Disease resistance protein n=1 Tax=Vitis vinifera TaxID=29760 RepID=A0ABY9CJA4_VITVI|nr:hypothetical protein VitviT2T_013998 [Vitis vinifera]